jgi:hypothetical protein
MSAEPINAPDTLVGEDPERRPKGGLLFTALIGAGVVGTLLWWGVLGLAAVHLLS